MNTMNHVNGTSFFSPLTSVCALCTALAFTALPATAALGGDTRSGKDVSVTDYGTVDLAVQDTDLAQVLQMLSIQSKKNIITSRSVSATVSANLFDVTFHEALDSILRVNGYGYIEEGNFIYIYTQSELEEIERSKRRTDWRIFELEHLAAADAREFVEPLLSDAGQISARGEVLAGFRPNLSDGGADNYAFSAKIVVNDYPEHLEAIADLLRSLDTPPQQVLVEATILQTALNEDNAFGVDFTVLGSINFTDLITPLNAVNQLLAGGDNNGFQPDDNRGVAVGSTVGGTAGPGGLKVGVIRDDISVFLRVLDEVTDSTILARPKIMALNRQRAEVLVGTKVGYLSTTATETTTTQSVEFLDTGIQLVFRPFISRDGMIRLELAPSVSEARLRPVTQATGVTVTIPDEVTNQLTTNVRVRDGQTLVLGGLFRESTSITRRQVPLLGDIPILGAAFRGQDDSVVRNEIIFLITPSIVKDETLWEMGRDTLSYAESVIVGGRAGLLPFSRTKVTASYNQQATEAFAAGDLDKAHYYINNSLRLDSNQPEMIKFRQHVTGVRESAHEASVMERVFRRKMGHVSHAPGSDDSHIAFMQEPFVSATPAFVGKPVAKSSQPQAMKPVAIKNTTASHVDKGVEKLAVADATASETSESTTTEASVSVFDRTQMYQMLSRFYPGLAHDRWFNIVPDQSTEEAPQTVEFANVPLDK